MIPTLFLAAAQAHDEPDTPTSEAEGEYYNAAPFARVALRGGVERGYRLEGNGTRVPYLGGEGGVGYDYYQVAWKRGGFAVAGDISGSTFPTDGATGLLWTGPFAIPLQGPHAMLIVAAGAGLWIGSRPSAPQPLRAYPALAAILRMEVGEHVLMGLQIQGAPITTDSLMHRFVLPEAWVAYRHVMVGSLARVDWRWTGEPLRLYPLVLMGAQAGAAF